MKSCEWCRCTFQSVVVSARYCRPLCRKRAENARRSSVELVCDRCGVAFRSKNKSARHCSNLCVARGNTRSAEERRAWVLKGKAKSDKEIARSVSARYKEHVKAGYRLLPCDQCGTPCDSRRKYCSGDCRAAANDFWINSIKGAVYECPICSVAFCPLLKNWGRRACSDECAQIMKNNQKRAGKQVRRAVINGARFEKVIADRVFDRDGWKCQICGTKTDRSRRGKHHVRSPELDHRVPLSKGGTHTYDNVQTACRSCNSEKSNRSSVGQMPLFDAA